MKKENSIYLEILKDLEIASPYGKIVFDAIRAYKKEEITELNHEFDRINDLILIIKNYHSEVIRIESILSSLKDLRNIIHAIKNSQVLDIISLYEIKIQSMKLTELTAIFNKLISNSLLHILSEEKVVNLLSDENVTYDFYLYNKYSNKLEEIRSKKSQIELKIRKAVNEEEKIILLNERNQIIQLEEKENFEVCKKLTNQLRPYVDIFEENIKRIGKLDLWIAKAKFSIKHQAVRPIIENGPIEIKQMFDPTLKAFLELKDIPYTKNDIIIDHGVCLITGANMSGKSTILKTIFINCYFAIRGFYVFASFMRLPLLDFIYEIYSDEGRSHGISSFGKEILNLNDALALTENGIGLLLFDEFGKSTNPYEGEIFVKALIELLKKCDSYTVIATHYDVVNLSINHYQVKGLKDEKIISPLDLKEINKYIDYELEKVQNNRLVPKEALRVAKLLNVNKKYLKTLEDMYRGD